MRLVRPKPPAGHVRCDHDTALARTGAVAALVAAGAYVVGFAVLLGALGERPDALGERLDALLGRRASMTAWYLAIYVLFGVALVALAVAVDARLRALAPRLATLACAFALIWATLVIAAGMTFVVGLDAAAALRSTDPDRAATLWLVVETVGDGLGGGVELVGGLWLVLLGVAGRRTAAFGGATNTLALLVGAAGMLTVLPPLGALGAVFGLGQILWFVSIAVALARGRHARAGIVSTASDALVR